MNTIEILRDGRDDFRWRLVTETGRVLAASPDAYRTGELARDAGLHAAIAMFLTENAGRRPIEGR